MLAEYTANRWMALKIKLTVPAESENVFHMILDSLFLLMSA